MASGEGMRALIADPTFRRLWLAGGATGIMRWLDTVVAGIYVFDVTGSPAWVAAVTFLRLAPMIFGVVLGALVARRALGPQLRLNLAAVVVTYATLAALDLFGLLDVWAVAAGSFVIGVYWSLENSVRRTLLGAVAGPARTGNAISLDWATINAMRLVGPFAGATLYAVYGIGSTYLLGIVVFGASLLLAAGASVGTTPATTGPLRIGRDIADSFAVARGSDAIKGVLGVSFFLNFFGFPYASMVPVIGKDVLRAAPAEVGMLSSAEGFGALVGGVVLTLIVRPTWFGVAFLAGSFCVAAGAIGFGLSSDYRLSVAVLILAGMGMSWFASMQSTIILAHAPAEQRSGSMGLLTTAIGSGQVGTLFLGWLAAGVGAPLAVTATASVSAALVAFCAWRWPGLWRGAGSSL